MRGRKDIRNKRISALRSSGEMPGGDNLQKRAFVYKNSVLYNIIQMG